MKKLLLVTASSPEIQEVRISRVINFQQITMPYLAAYVPEGWDVQHVDEVEESVDESGRYDLVAITFHTPSAPHAYRMADRFRSLGSTVVLGGPHVTLVPDEAQQHADAIFVGEAEGLWERFLGDLARGSHAPLYRAEAAACLDGLPMARKDLFHRRDHAGGVLFATRGCRFRCEFCTLPVIYPGGYRKRPVGEVAREFASFPGKVVIFWDDNLAADVAYSKALFREIRRCDKWWSSQVSVHAGMDDEYLALAAASGCKQLFLGLESVTQDSLDASNKGFNSVRRYGEIVDRIHSHGISVQVGVVLGFDHDRGGVFDETLDFLESAGVQNATFNILTPYPGTPLFERLRSQGRITSLDWSRYNGRTDVVFLPKHLSPEELQAGFERVNRRFYSLASIARRLRRSPVQLWWTLPLNLAYHRAWRRAQHRRAGRGASRPLEDSQPRCIEEPMVTRRPAS